VIPSAPHLARLSHCLALGASHDALAIVMFEATWCEELDEVLVAIERIHARYCAECRKRGPRDMRAETVP
jgi:hypothetical protein